MLLCEQEEEIKCFKRDSVDNFFTLLSFALLKSQKFTFTSFFNYNSLKFDIRMQLLGYFSLSVSANMNHSVPLTTLMRTQRHQ